MFVTRNEAGKRPTLTQVLKAGLRRPPQRPGPTREDGASPLKRSLQGYQTAMLLADYQDFARQPRFTALVEFFFSALYAPADFGVRNDSLRTLHEWLAGLIGHDPVRVLAHAIDLYELTDSLDDDMVLALRSLGANETGLLRSARDDWQGEDEKRAVWEAAYRLVGRRLDRQRQAHLIVENGIELERACRVPFVHTQLRAARPAVALLGWGHVIDFLLQGQEAMAQARPIRPLLDAIAEREQARINRLLPHS